MTHMPDFIIQEDGSCPKKYQDLISDSELKDLLNMMIVNRVFEKRLLLLQRQGRVGFSLQSLGEEGITIGAGYCLNNNDPMFLSYREMGSLLARGVSLPQILNQFFGNSQDDNKGRQMPVHYAYKEAYIPSVSSPVGTQLPHACGYAYAAKLQKTGQVALAFLGEGTASSNDFHSALNFSGVLNVPVIYIIRNNGYAISTPTTKQTASKNLAVRAQGYGIEGVQINGNDILSVIGTIRNAVKKAREGSGPTLIEAMTYRLGAHSSSDDPSGYRSKKEEESHKKEDVLTRTIQHAKYRKIWTDKDSKRAEKEIDQHISDYIKTCESYASPPLTTLFDDVYAAIPNHINRQKDMYLQFLKQHGDHS